MNAESIDIYLSKGRVQTIYLNDCILNESFGISELKDKVVGFVQLAKILVNLEGNNKSAASSFCIIKWQYTKFNK